MTRTRTRLDTDERRERLLVLGRSLFSRHPYDTISIEDIAAEARVSKGLLYHYFESKHRFYLETVRHAFDEMSVVTEPDPSLPVSDRILASLGAYLDYVERNGPVYEMLMSSGVGSDPKAQALVERQRTLISDRVLAGIGLREANPAMRTALRAWIGFIDGATLDWHRHRDVDRTVILSLLTRSLEAALATALETLPPPRPALPPIATGTRPTGATTRTKKRATARPRKRRA